MNYITSLLSFLESHKTVVQTVRSRVLVNIVNKRYTNDLSRLD